MKREILILYFFLDIDLITIVQSFITLKSWM